MRPRLLAAMAGLLTLGLTVRAQTLTDRLGDPLPEGAIQRLGTLKMRYGSVGGLTYLPDGRGVVLSGAGVDIWDLATGTLESSTPVAATTLTSVELRADGQALLLGDGAGGVYEWDPQRRVTLRSWKTEQGGLCSARYSPDGTRFLVGGRTPMGCMEYDVQTGTRTAEVTADFATTRCGAIYGPDGTTVIMGGGYEHLLEHRMLATGELLHKWATNYEAKQIRLSPDRTTVLVGTEAYAEEYLLSDYSLLHRYDAVPGEAGRCFAHDFAPRRNEAVLGLRTGSVHRFDRATGQEVLGWMAHPGWISAVAVSPDERYVLSFGGGLLVESDMETGRPRLNWARHGGPVRAVAFTPSGDRVISGSEDATLRVWDPLSGECLLTIEGATLGAYALAVSPNGSTVAAGCKDGVIREFALADGELLRERPGHRGFVRSLVWTHDGQRLVSSADDGSVRIWGQDANEPPLKLEGHLGGVLSVAVSADGRLLLSGGRDGTVRLWDLAGARQVGSLGAHRGWVEAVAFAGKGRWAVSAGGDGRLMRWDLEGRADPVAMDNGSSCALAVSPDGNTLHCATGSGVKSWDLRLARLIGQREGHAGAVTSLAVSPDGRMIVTGSADTSLLVWDAPAAE
ncbi:MAG: WD40 repeat domain-containing protein [Armatimonadota bacterium]